MTSASRRTGLPCRRQLAVTWGIPDRYGGMTAALLRRSRQFARAGADVEVVTFESRPDYDAVRARLEERGELAGGVGLRNIYEDFRTRTREPVPGLPPAEPAERSADEATDVPAGSVHRWMDDEGIARIEHRRADGSLAVLEQRSPAAPHRRVVTAFDSDGRATGQWASVRRFRFAWLDELVGADPAVAIVDSKTAARVMQHYRRPNVTRIHHVHGAHHDAQGRLSEARREVFEHLDRWDGVAFLTERQRAAAIAQLGDTGNLDVVHNAVTVPDRMPRLALDRLHGVIVARLTRRKRIDHGLAAMARVRERGVPVTAEIIGDGADLERLRSEAQRLGLADAVRFTGYLADGAARFADGAWIILTSTSEGESLALLEAMGAGCIPIAYDIPYGPADVVRDGRNGFLIADGDVVAVAEALASVCRLPDDRLAELRREARSAAQHHDDDAALRQWARAQRAAMRRHRDRERRAHPSALRRAARRVKRLSRGAVPAPRGSTPRPR